MFDFVPKNKLWREDPSASFNENVLYGCIHFTKVFFGKYRVTPANNEDYDDMAAACVLAVYDSAMRNLDKWDRNYRLDQYLFARAWSIVGGWLKKNFKRHSKELRDVHLDKGGYTPVEYDVGVDELDLKSGKVGRYSVFVGTTRDAVEKAMSPVAIEFLDYYDDCLFLGIAPVSPEEFDNSICPGDLMRIRRILDGSAGKSAVGRKVLNKLYEAAEIRSKKSRRGKI
jgi:hypothetical protein